MKIGIIGTGMLGTAVGLRLFDSGFELTVYNRTRAKTKGLQDRGIRVLESPKEVAQNSELLITIVRDANAVNEISFGRNGIVEGIHKNLTVADMSTINPFESKSISDRFAQHGIEKLDAPVMGGPNVAISGELVVMVSGSEEVFEKFRNVFKVIGNNVFYLGKSSVAHTVKLAMNLQISLLALALSEGITLVEKAGVNPEMFLKVLNSTYFKTGMSQNKAYKMIMGEYNPTFTLNNLAKDIETMTNTADKLKIKLPTIKKAEEIYQKASRDGFGELDYTGIIAYIKKMNDSGI